MPYTPITEIGTLDTLLARTADSAEQVANIQVAITTQTGQASSVSVTGDALAAVRESFAALRDHQLAFTSDPRISTALLDFWSQVDGL